MCARLEGVVGVPREQGGQFHTYQTFVIHAERRAALLEHLAARGVDAKVHYPIAIPEQPAARDLGVRMDEFPNTKWLTSRIVSLPLYAEMDPEQKDLVIDAVRSFYAP